MHTVVIDYCDSGSVGDKGDGDVGREGAECSNEVFNCGDFWDLVVDYYNVCHG